MQLLFQAIQAVLVSVIVSLASVGQGVSDAAGGHLSLTVTINNVPTTEGAIQLALYDSADTWLDRPARSAVVDHVASDVVANFYDLPPGMYAIAAFHDENENGKLDRNLLGMPREAYGFSNNMRPTFGPASWDEARIALTGDDTQIVIEF